MPRHLFKTVVSQRYSLLHEFDSEDKNPMSHIVTSVHLRMKRKPERRVTGKRDGE